MFHRHGGHIEFYFTGWEEDGLLSYSTSLPALLCFLLNSFQKKLVGKLKINIYFIYLLVCIALFNKIKHISHDIASRIMVN